jgi:hypothetical protein
MKTFEQLELQLWQTLQEAQAMPEEANLDLLWDELETAIVGRDLKEQLEVSAEAILQIAGLVQERCMFRFEELVARHSDEGPVMPEDTFDLYVRQSMEVDFDQFVETIGRKEHEYPEFRELVSVVEEVSKEELLELLEDEPIPMLELEHDEDVAAWAAIVREWMVLRGVDSVSIGEIVESTQLSSVKVWIAGLLSDFELVRLSRKDKDFYDAEQLILRIETFARCEVA